MEITELTHASELDTCGIDIEKVMLCCTVSCIKDNTPFDTYCVIRNETHRLSNDEFEGILGELFIGFEPLNLKEISLGSSQRFLRKKEITQFTEDYKIPIFAVVNPVPNEETEVTE